MNASSRFLALAVVAPAVLLGVAGCRVEAHKGGSGNEQSDVKIATPFGHMQVNTKPGDVQDSVGMSVYPGATPEKKDDGHTDQADINFSFGRFKLRVKALSFLTPDPVDKVAAFYRKDLAKYGTVITCQGHRPVGEPTRTAEGLTCEEDHDNHGSSANVGDSDLELKTGSKQHQHIIGLERQGDQTKIGMVALDLPGEQHDRSDGDRSDDQRQ